MSWDVMIVNSKGMPADSEALPDDAQSEPLGEASRVRELVSSVLPGVDWSDPTWGLYQGDGFTIEFSIGDEDPVDDAMLHVRGSGDPLPSIAEVCKRGQWLAYDAGDGSAIDLENPSRAGWNSFVDFRDSVAASLVAESGGQLAVAGTEVTLPLSDLHVADGQLVSTDGKNVLASHALSEMRNLRFGTGTRVFAIVASFITIGLTVASKLWIPIGWLSWLLAVVFGLLAVKFLFSVRGSMLWFLEGGMEHSYPLLGADEEIEAFSSGLRRACQEARGKR